MKDITMANTSMKNAKHTARLFERIIVNISSLLSLNIQVTFHTCMRYDYMRLLSLYSEIQSTSHEVWTVG